MTNPDDIRFITRYYEGLRGWMNLPVALVFIALATQHLFPGPLWQQGDCTITLPLFAVAIAAMAPINLYYRKRYGAVQVLRPGQYTWISAVALISIILIGWIDDRLFPRLPVSLYVLVIAGWMAAAGWDRRRWYYRVFAGVLALVAFLPSFYFRIGAEQFPGVLGASFNLVFGLGWAIMGLLDHRLLTRLLKPVQEAGQ